MSVDSQLMGTTNVLKEFAGLGVGQKQTEHNTVYYRYSKLCTPETGAICSSFDGKTEVPPV